MDIYRVIIAPHITEKANAQKDSHNQFTFKVHKKANKVEIRRAVEILFKTKVLDVKTQNIIGKKRRVGRNIGKRPDWKKATVTLVPGKHIEFFEGM
ncbi:MAG: 50S ribosomal protein L23 [Deltaproteobacteria bacterium]|nr:50S ribosomal protein L23 [Deltaproteobacteria bacterium]